MREDMRRVEDWADRVADIATAEANELLRKGDEELAGALAVLREAAAKVQALATARFHGGQEPNRVQRPAP